MVSLVDIGPAMAKVPLRGKELDIVGITAADIFRLFFKFPELRRLVTGKPKEDTMAVLFAEFPHVLATCVAACLGKVEDEAEIKAAENLTVGEQWLIVQTTLEITFPQGVTNFIDGLLALTGQSGGVSGWVAATTLPVPSSNASEQAEPKPTVGDQPHGNSTPGAS